jgi:hypothetical protein
LLHGGDPSGWPASNTSICTLQLSIAEPPLPKT